MARKTKIVQLQVADAQSKLNELQALKIQAEQDAQQAVIAAEQEVLAAEQAAEQARIDEIQQIEDIRTHVTEYCGNEGFFCGVILNREALVNLFKFALETPDEQIKIPFQLYFNE